MTTNTYTFAQFLEYGRRHGAGIVDGKTWHFKFYGHQVTHENNELYIVGNSNPSMRFTPADLIHVECGELVISNGAATQSPQPPQAAVPVAWYFMSPDSGKFLRKLDWHPHTKHWQPLYASPPDDAALMRRALEALEGVWDFIIPYKVRDQVHAAIADLRARLAKGVKE